MADMVTPEGADGQTVDGLIDAMAQRLSNWGRWGSDDELGTLNLITEKGRVAAAASVRTGQVVSLALPLVADSPQVPGGGRFNAHHVMTETGTDALAAGGPCGYSDDAIAMSVHAHTHWDALSHVFHRGRMFNDRSAALVSARGAAVNDIVPMSRCLVTRGVLVDLAPGGDALPPEHEITVPEIEVALEQQGATLNSGDALLLRTGHLGRIRASGRWADFSAIGDRNPEEPGIGHHCLPWLHELGISAIACDNWAVEVLYGRASTRMPVHEIGIVHMGLALGEMFDLDALAASCAADDQWDFLFSAGPLPISGGVGGPVNPLAIR
jgi:kynurenine formamidase